MFNGTYAPYGYRKSADGLRRLIPDPETAPVVRRIFQLRCEGKSPRTIALLLNQQGASSPRGTHYSTKGPAEKRGGYWSENSIRNILCNEAYIGNLMQGKRTALTWKNHKLVHTDTEDWIFVAGAHEPIIELSVWDMVQSLTPTPKKQQEKNRSVPVSTFVGYLRCADCGARLRSVQGKRVNKAGETVQYISFMCGTYAKSGKLACSIHSISEQKLMSIVLSDIHKWARLAADDESLLHEKVMEHRERDSVQKHHSILKELGEIKERIAAVESEAFEYYESHFTNTIPENVLRERLRQLDTERRKLQQRQIILSNRSLDMNRTIDEIVNWVKAVKRCDGAEHLTYDIISQLIDYIEVGESEILEGKRQRKVKIAYCCGMSADAAAYNFYSPG